MQKKTIAGVAAAVAIIGGLAIAQTVDHSTMDHSGMDHSGMDMADMGMMSHGAMIPPELADNAAVVAYAEAMDRMMVDMMTPIPGMRMSISCAA
jgi:uncharacterized protein involved in copper resistance